jgi:uncharacterized damage-inducible protein DinB
MSQLAENAAGLLFRELAALRRELEAYPDDQTVWEKPESLPNSAGTLTLHLCGNLRHFVGARLGQSDYVRDRPREFAARDISRADLLRDVLEAEAEVRRVLPAMTDAQMEAPYVDPLFDHTFSTGDFIMHLCSHFAYHLGQIDYHRRLVTGQNVSVGAVPPTGLRTAKLAPKPQV